VQVASEDEATGRPFVVEVAFAFRSSGGIRRLITGINWSPTIADPFRHFSSHGVGLAGLLGSLHINYDSPVTVAIHLATPHLKYTDRGKSSLEGL
jgi:hypothetical protein